ncbi:MAG: hypothetical protein ACYS6W_05345 [Planctomycetota bacterium]|jgi:hypothetical protein
MKGKNYDDPNITDRCPHLANQNITGRFCDLRYLDNHTQESKEMTTINKQ